MLTIWHLLLITLSIFIFYSLAILIIDKTHLNMMKENLSEEDYKLYEEYYKRIGGLGGQL